MKSKAHRRSFARAAAITAAAVAAFATTSAIAANQTWDAGAVTQEWETPANWTNDALPIASIATINTSTGLFPKISANSSWKPTDVEIGNATGQTGRLDHSAGLLQLNVVGANGNWFFAGKGGGTGTYNLADTAATGGALTGFGQGTGNLTVGKLFAGGAYYSASGIGTLNINTTGTVNAQSTQNFTGQGTSSIVVGFGTGTGTMNVDSGTVNAAGIVDIAAAQSNAQTVTGTLNLGAAATFNSENDFRLAYAGNASSLATLNVTGGTLNVGSTVKRWMVAGTWDFANSTTTVSSGNINLNTNTDLKFKIQTGTGTHTVNLNGGAITSYSDNHVTANGAGILDLGSAGSTGTNTFNLNGGTLSIRQIVTTNNTPTGVFNFNGGVLKATGDNANFIDLGGATQSAVVKSGGALINSNGYAVTIPQALVAGSPSGGLTKSGAGTLTLTGANTYTGATTVNGGTLTVSGNSVNTSSSVIINGSGARYNYTSATAGTNAITVTQGTLDGTGSVGAVTVGAGTGGIVTNGNGTTNKLTAASLTFSGAGSLNLNLPGGVTNTAQGLDVSGTLTTPNTVGSVVVTVVPTTPLTVGTTYNLVNFGTFSGTISDFVYAGNTARKTGTFDASGGILTLTINGDTPKWTGEDGATWVVGSTGPFSNWKLVTADTATDYIEGDDVSFTDEAFLKSVDITAANVSPASTTFTNSSGNDYTVASTGGFGITGTGPLVKSGDGKLTLATTNTYAGGTTINAGTLQLGDGTTDGSIVGTSGVTNNGTLAYNLTGSSTAAYAISGTGSVTKDGTGAVTLAGANSYSGSTTLNAGTVSAGSATALGTGSLVINGGTLDSSAANLTLSTNNVQDWNADFAFTGTNSLNLGTGAVTMNANRIVTVNANTLTVGGAISGSSYSLTKAGAGMLALMSANSYSGGTTINGGTFAIGGTAPNNSGGLGSGAVTINPGGNLRTGYAVSSNTNVVNVTNEITLAGGSIFADDGFQHLTGSINVTAASTLGATYNSGNNGAAEKDKGLFLDGVVGGSANLTIQHSGIATGFAYTTSIVHFNNSGNTYSGTITVVPMAGSLTTSGGSFLGLNATNALQYATINLSGNQTGNKFGTSPLVFNKGIGSANIGALEGSGNVVLTGYDQINHNYTGGENIALSVGSNNASTTYSGILSGGGSVTKAGTGTMLLSGTSTFTGDLIINGGTVTANTMQGMTPAASNLGALQPVTNRNIIVNGGGILSLINGNILGTGASTNTLSNTTLVVNAGGLFETGKDGAGAGWWNKVGAVNLNGGTIRVGSGANNTNYLSLALIGTVTVGGSSASVIDTHLSSDPAYTAIHLGQNTATGQSVIFDVADVTGTSGADLTVAATLTNTSAYLVASGLTKIGAGTMTLGAANAYTGATAINAGTLALSGTGAIDTSPTVSIATGAALDTTAKTGTFTPPASQTLVIGLDATGTGSSGVINAANLDLSTAVVSFNITGTLDDPEYVIANYSGSLSGTIAASPPSGYAFDYGTGSNSQIKLVPAAGYTSWADTNAPTGGANDDYDNDGVPNGVEYVLGGLASTNDIDKLPVVGTAGGNLTFSFVRDQASETPDTTVNIEVGTTLTAWPTIYPVPNDPVAASPGVTVVDNLDGTDTITLTIAIGTDALKFARLAVTIE